MTKLMMPAFLVMILSGVPLVAQEEPQSADHGSVERATDSPEGDYARREQDAGHLEAFRGGAAGDGGVELLLVPFLVFVPLIKLLALAFGVKS